MTVNILEFIRRESWNVSRFGLSPRKIWYRVFAGDSVLPRVFVISVPKSGTHLIERALCLHPRLYRRLFPTIHPGNLESYGGLENLVPGLDSGQIIISHLYHSGENAGILADNGIKTLFTVRDPRDILVSNIFYISRNSDHLWHDLFQAQPDISSRIRLSILGSEEAGYPSAKKRFENFVGWLDSPALVIRFEDLIGASGGGSRDRSLGTLRSVYQYLNMDIGDDEIRGIYQRLYSSVSPTFRKGLIGQWEQYFDQEIVELFESVAGDVLKKYGYSW